MKDLKHIKRFNESEENLNISDVRSSKKITEQLDNHDKKVQMEYEDGIRLYEEGLNNIEKCIELFENSPWGVPEELDMLFGERQGNEALRNLQKEVKHLKEGDYLE